MFVPIIQIQSVTFHTWQPNCNELLECLENTNLIQWKNEALLINVAPECSEMVKNLVQRKGGAIRRARSCQGLIFKRTNSLNFNKTRYVGTALDTNTVT